MRAMRAAALSLAVPALLCAARAVAAGESPADLVYARRGELPILLTAPHGGRRAIPGIAPRDIARERDSVGARKWGGVIGGGGDPNTDLLAERIAARIEALTGKAPYVVVAKFQRKYVDANRPPELAFDRPQARPYYEQYHRFVRRYVDEIRRDYPAGLLIDVHGQARMRDAVMRGTRNGWSVDRLLRRAGEDAITGRLGLFGQLEANGFKVFPGNDVPPRGHSEDAGFNGGYTVSIYGSEKPNGIDAVQLEFGTDYRRTSVLDRTANAAAKAIVTFYETYLVAAR
jgi:N-formylglutamate amidohydrolase